MTTMLKVKLVRSMAGRPRKHRRVLKALRLTRINKVATFVDRPEIRGMVQKVRHLVEAEIVEV